MARMAYFRVISQAKNNSLKEFRGKYGNHTNLATVTVDRDTPRMIGRKCLIICDVEDVETQAKTRTE